MTKTIDCLFIGHNETDFREYEENIRGMGTDSTAYRDLNLNFIRYNDRPYTAAEIFNLFYCHDNGKPNSNKPLRFGDTFSPAIAYLGTYLSRRGCTFDYVNAFQEEKDRLKEKLQKEDILLVAVITTLYVSVFPILEIMDFIKKYNRTARIVIGGPFVSTQVRSQEPPVREYLFKNTIGADFYINSSQGETTLVKLIGSLKYNLPLNRVNNLYYKVDNNKYAAAPIVKEDNKLAENPVNWELFPGQIKEIVNVRTSISCPFSCAFCGFPEHAGKYQTVSPGLMMEELTLLEKIGAVKILNFIDDTFNVPVKRFKELLRGMMHHKYKFKWVSNFRCQFADREMVELMRDSGCEGVFLGLESGNNQVLENMNKAANVEKYLEGIAWLKEFKIATFGSFVIGFPGETEETVRETVKFIEESEIDFFRAQLWYCDPITPIWEQRDKYGLQGESFEWKHASMDSREASDLIDEIFLSIKNSTWVPQYHFGFDNLWHLKLRGMSPERIKRFLNGFSSGIKEKLINPSQKEISFRVIKELQQTCAAVKGKEGGKFDNIDNIDEKKEPKHQDRVKFNF